jgi:hypothetical protein
LQSISGPIKGVSLKTLQVGKAEPFLTQKPAIASEPLARYIEPSLAIKRTNSAISGAALPLGATGLTTNIAMWSDLQNSPLKDSSRSD